MIRCFFTKIILLFVTFQLSAKEIRVCTLQNPDELGLAAAQKMADRILEKQKNSTDPFVLGLATGSSPLTTYSAFKKIVKEKGVDLSNVITINLDEYLGLPSSHPQSYHSFMFTALFNDLLYSPENSKGIKLENIHIPKGNAQTLEDFSSEELASFKKQFPNRVATQSLSKEEQFWIGQRRATAYEELIQKVGPIDLQILGIGTNGHIAFDEPGTPFSSLTSVVKLSENTRKDNARFFEGNIDWVPYYAITMGIQTILQAEEIFLLANGTHKAEIIAKTLQGPITTSIPATCLRKHPNVSFFLDEDAASHLPVKRFYNAKILRNHEFQEGELWVREGVIIPPKNKADKEIDLHEALVAPGFIDLQINGGFGYDFSRNPEKLGYIAKSLPSHGVTAFLTTVISCSPVRYQTVLPLLQPCSFENKGATNLGIHLEGPFFSLKYRGAHNEEFLVPYYEPGMIEKVYGSLQGVKLVTLAPELPGSLDLIRFLRKKEIVVSAGHTDCSYTQMQEAIHAGLGFTTHLFNAMRPFHHRDPGIIGCALFNSNLSYSLIVDNVHLHPETTLLCWHCNPEGLILVTDAMEALGLANGKYQLGTMDIEVNHNGSFLSGTQKLAGSRLSLDEAVRNLHRITNCSKESALEAASAKPAQLLNLYPNKGSLEIGADADFIILSEDLQVTATFIGGKLAWPGRY